MKAEFPRYTVRLTQAAEGDFREILTWTEEHFGARQVSAYSLILQHAVEALRDGHRTFGAKARGDVSPGLFALRVARLGSKGRHLLLFRIDESGSEPIVRVIRILHDSMDIARHMPEG